MRRLIGFFSVMAALSMSRSPPPRSKTMRSSFRILALLVLLGLTGSSALTGCLTTSEPSCQRAGGFCDTTGDCCGASRCEPSGTPPIGKCT
jgi:hypothetical protein